MDTTTPQKRALSIKEACATLGIGRTTLRRQTDAGNIRVVKLGRRRLIPAEEINRLLTEAPRA